MLENEHSEKPRSEQEPIQRQLLRIWIDQLENVQVSEKRAPVINKTELLRILEESSASQQPVVFMAIGCQDWIKPEWGNDNDRVLGRLSDKNKRAQRFAAELQSFSQALSSFSVPHQIHFSLSDIEALIHLELKDMGLHIHNTDGHEVLEKNTSFLAEKLLSSATPIIPFRHSEALLNQLEAADLVSLRQLLTGKTHSDFREFLDKLYEHDLAKTAQQFMPVNGLGPVWLDIQSFNFSNDVISFEQTAKKVAPNMPILSLFPNAGNWHAAPEPLTSFSKKSDLLAHLIGTQSTPHNDAEWVRLLHKTKDERLNELFTLFGREPLSITSGIEKTLAVRLLFQLVFDLDPMAEQMGANEKK